MSDRGVVNLISAKLVSNPGTARILRVLGIATLLLGTARSQSPTASEYQVKAAFLYNFAKFVEWPPSSFSSPSAPLQICVYGRDPFGEELRNITSEKMVNGHKLEVHRAMNLEQARKCHILFVAFSGAPVKSILESLRGASVLTVGDCQGFAEQGGMINFELVDGRIQFEVNRKAVDEAGLKISSKLLSVAKRVIV